VLQLDVIAAEVVGVINIVVYKTSDGDNFFQIEGSNENLLPVLDVIEDLFIRY